MSWEEECIGHHVPCNGHNGKKNASLSAHKPWQSKDSFAVVGLLSAQVVAILLAVQCSVLY